MSAALRFALALGTAPAALAAQSHPLVGTWTLTKVQGGTRISEGAATAVFSTGTLVIISVGDSLVATLTVVPPEGRPARPPMRIAAKRTDGDVTFSTRYETQGTLNGQALPMATPQQLTMALKVVGDSLTGTLERKPLEADLPGAGPQPIAGTRANP